MANTSDDTFKVPSGNFEIQIGSDSSCEFSTPHLPPMAAGLKRRGDRLFVKDFGCRPGLSVNDKRIKKRRWFEVTRYDNLKFGILPFNLSPAVFLGRDRLDLDSSKLKLELPNGKILCDGVYIRANNGTVTVIMGPSGAGKTVFLNMLNGYTLPSEGMILINNKFDLHAEYKSVRDYIGYVPQDDIMISELTLRQSLHYRLRLRYPDMALSVRQKLIEETCKSLGFKGNELNAFLNTVIGSPESGISGLSGGEKRRANIAHELVLKPLILVLDEPTSGLSSIDSERVVKLLKDLAMQSGLTVIATIHQPSRDAFKHFDDLLMIGLGGKIAFYGRSEKAVEYFENTTGARCSGRNPPEFLMSFLSSTQHCNQSVNLFENTLKHKRVGSNTVNYIYDSIPLSSKKNPTPLSKKRSKKYRKKGSLYQDFRQCFILLNRNLRVLFRDKLNLLLLFGQVPVIGVLIFLAFHNFSHDSNTLNQFSRKIYYFDLLKAPLEKQGKSIPVDSLMRQASEKAEHSTDLISEVGSRQRGAVYFVLVAASIWFGILGGCKEIVTEQHILKRELRSFVNLMPCLLSKLSLLVLLVGVQTGLLSASVAPILLDLTIASTLKLWIVLWITAVTSATLGLCVSSFSRTYRFALTAVPLILIPQLIFGGHIRPFSNLDDNIYWPQIIGGVTIQRWAFQASLNVDPYSNSGVLKQFVGDHKPGTRNRYAELNIIQYKDSNIMKSFFRNKFGDSFFFPIGMLLIFSTIFLFSSYWRMKRIFLF